MMKRVITFLLIIVCVFVLIGCKKDLPHIDKNPDINEKDNNDDKDKGDDTDKDKENIEVIVTYLLSDTEEFGTYTYNIDEQIILPIPEKENYAFVGWINPQTNSQATLPLKTSFNEDTSLVALFTESTTGLEFTLVDGEYSVSNYTGSSVDIIIPSHYQGIKVTKIGVKSFINNYKISTVSLPETIIKIEEEAFFRNDRLEEINFPDSLVEIGKKAFAYCNNLILTEINVPVIGESAFEGCTRIVDIVFLENVKVIEKYAFYGCSMLSNVKFLGIVDVFGKKIFDWCVQLEAIYVQEEFVDLYNNYIEKADIIYTKNPKNTPLLAKPIINIDK